MGTDKNLIHLIKSRRGRNFERYVMIPIPFHDSNTIFLKLFYHLDVSQKIILNQGKVLNVSVYLFFGTIFPLKKGDVWFGLLFIQVNSSSLACFF